MRIKSANTTVVQAGPSRKAQVSLLRVLLLLIPALALFCMIFILWILRWDKLPVSPRSACIANLFQIQGAKDTWALENKKLPTDTPAEADLFGKDKYIVGKLICREGGRYTLGAVGESPTCSIPGHTYQRGPEN